MIGAGNKSLKVADIATATGYFTASALEVGILIFRQALAL